MLWVLVSQSIKSHVAWVVFGFRSCSWQQVRRPFPQLVLASLLSLLSRARPAFQDVLDDMLHWIRNEELRGC